MKRRDIVKHSMAVCALIVKTGTYSGPVQILYKSVEDVPLSWEDFCSVLEDLAKEKCITMHDSKGITILTLTDKGQEIGRNFGQSMAIHKAATRQGPIEEDLN